MGLDDKISNAAEDLQGKGKEAAGKSTDDESLEREGQADQTKANLKKAGAVSVTVASPNFSSTNPMRTLLMLAIG